MNYLIQTGMEHKMQPEINNMLSVRNLINESYNDIFSNGKIAAEKQDIRMFKARRVSFEECFRLYTISIESLREFTDALIEKEANEILSDSGIIITENAIANTEITIPEFTTLKTIKTEPVSNEFDNTNVIDLIQSGNIVGMIDHVVKYHKLGQYSVIKSTFNIWETVAKSDQQCEEYLEDIKEYADIEPIIKEIYKVEQVDQQSA